MVELGCGPGLAPEPVDVGLVGRQLRPQDLDGHLPPETAVDTLVDVGHAAASDVTNQLVALGEDAIHARAQPMGLSSEPFCGATARGL